MDSFRKAKESGDSLHRFANGVPEIVFEEELVMVTRFVTLEVDLHTSPTELKRSIATELKKWGDPLRWAIVAVDRERQKIQIEAVVTTPTEFIIPNTPIKIV